MLLHQIRQPLDITLAQGVVIHGLHILQSGPAQQCTARRRRFEQPVQVGAEDLPVSTLRTITAAVIQMHGGTFQGRSGGHAGMNFITLHRRIIQRQATTHIAQLLLLFELGLER